MGIVDKEMSNPRTGKVKTNRMGGVDTKKKGKWGGGKKRKSGKVHTKRLSRTASMSRL